MNSGLLYEMQYRTLGHTGLQVSRLGFGASPLGNEFGPVDTTEAESAVHLALDSGVNFFDVAPYYGRGLAEQRLGTALQGHRHRAIVATKCGRDGVANFDFSAARVRSSIDESLSRLGTEYVDVLHVHDIEYGDRRQIVKETIPALREVQKAGKARFIGITGLSVKMLRDVASEVPVDCILSYCRHNLLNRDMDTVLAPYAREHGIGLINASPLHMRLLTDEGPPEWHPAPTEVKKAAHQVVQLCRQMHASVSDVAIQFAVEHPYVSSTIVGISTRAEMQKNLRAIEASIDPNLLAEIERIVEPVKRLSWITGRPENH
jgi:L-galactose dehydrogenase